MKRLVIYILISIPLAISCQQKYNTPPYDQEEVSLRAQNVNDTSLIISKDWEKRDSLSYLRFKDAKKITFFQTDSIPMWVIKFSKAKSLVSYSCEHIYINDNIGDLSSLEVIAMYDTEIDDFPVSIKKLIGLKDLSLKGNKSNTIPEWIKELSNIETLLLNDFDGIPSGIFELKNLKVLWLVNCNITELPSSISQLKQLEVLHIHANPIESLPEEIFELQNLRDIYYDKERFKDEQFKERLDEMVRRNGQKYREQKFEQMKAKN